MRVPPRKLQMTLRVNPPGEKRPVKAAVVANWKLTILAASLKRLSVPRMDSCRSVRLTSFLSSDTAMASVGPKVAPRAKAAGRLMAAQRAWTEAGRQDGEKDQADGQGQGGG